MSDLMRLTNGWLLTNVPSLSIIIKVVLDRYLRALPSEMKAAASMQINQSLEELLTAVEIHQNTQDLLKGSRAEKVDAERVKEKSLCPSLHAQPEPLDLA